MVFDLIARLVNRHGWLVLVCWVALAAALRSLAPSWDDVSLDDDVHFFPPGSLSVTGQDLLERGFPEVTDSTAVVVAERPDGPLTAADRAFIEVMVQRLEERVGPETKLRGVTDIGDPFMDSILVGGTGEGGDGQSALTLVAVDATYLSKQARLSVNVIEEVLAGLRDEVPEGLSLAMTGSAVVGHDTNEASNSSIDTTTIATIALVVAILLLVYRSPLLALIPLVAIALSVFISLKGLPALIWVPGLEFQVINVTKVFVIVVLFGAGTDYCLFLIARYREERARGLAIPEALGVAIRQVGAALVASAGTVIVGLGMLWFSSFAKIQYSGPSIALSLSVALAAALTVAPVLLKWFGNAVDWPFRGRREGREVAIGGDFDEEAAETHHGLWSHVADAVVARPGLILVACLLPLAALAVLGTRARSNYGMLADLPADAPSQVGARLIRDDFPIGELGPATLLIDAPAVDFRTAEGRRIVGSLTDRLEAMDEVADVRSLTHPLGEPLAPTLVGAAETPQGNATLPMGLGGFLRRQLDRAQGSIDAVAERGYRAAEPVYVSARPADPADVGHITRLDVILDLDPFSEQGLNAMDALLAEVEGALADGGAPLAGASFGFAGATPQLYDLRAVIGVDQHRMYLLVTLGVYAILVVLLRRPGISLYLIATVVLGYLATLGLTEFVFRTLHTGPEPWNGLDWKVSFFLFVILVAVGEDYNIFLMSRVVEEERSHPPIDATRRAVATTGGIISSCGLIMAGTFGSMLTGRLLALRELGFALCLGVLLDTFIVRPVLVPAFLVLLERHRPGRVRPGRAARLREQEEPVGNAVVLRVDYGVHRRDARAVDLG